MHTRGQGDFFDFPCSEKPLIKGFDLRVEACRHERAHVARCAHARGLPRWCAGLGRTVAIQGCHADQGRNLLPRERPQLGEFQQERPRTYRSNAGPSVTGRRFLATAGRRPAASS